MPYSPTSWTDGSGASIDAANLNNLESGVSKAAYAPDATANQVPVGTGSAWVYQLLKDAQVDPAAAIAYSKLALAGHLVNADVATGAAIAYAKLNLAGAVKDSDIAAAQNLTKLSAVTGTPTGAKFLRDDGTWSLPAGLTTYRKTTAKIVNNTVVATDLLNGEITVGAGVMGTTGLLRMTAFGDVLTNTGVATALPVLTLALGGTTLLQSNAFGTFFANIANRRAWRIIVEILNLGSASSQQATMQVHFSTIGNNNDQGGPFSLWTTGEGSWGEAGGGTSQTSHLHGLGTNTTAVNTAVGQALTLTTTNPVANVSWEMKLAGALVEVI